MGVGQDMGVGQGMGVGQPEAAAWLRGCSLRSRSGPVQTPARVNVTCVTPLGEEVVSTL
jgi:hypothetical protein